VPFSLHESALYALLAVDPASERRLLSVIEQIEAAPMQCVHGSRMTPGGRVENVCFIKEFRICFSIEKNGDVMIHDIFKA